MTTFVSFGSASRVLSDNSVSNPTSYQPWCDGNPPRKRRPYNRVCIREIRYGLYAAQRDNGGFPRAVDAKEEAVRLQAMIDAYERLLLAYAQYYNPTRREFYTWKEILDED